MSFNKLKPEGSNPDLYTSVSADDSSDEDEQVESYDIREQIEEYKLYSSSKWNLERKEIDQNNILSFITHAAGIYILYSPSVQLRYYELKKEKLLSTLQFKNDADIKEEIEHNFKEIKYWAGKKWRNENTDKVNILDVIKTDMYSKIVEDKISYMEDYKRYNGFCYIASLFRKNNLKPKDVKNLRISDYCLNPVKNFTRKTLDTPDFDLSTIPEEMFVTEFLAHLRLHNRSQKRHIKNKEECKNTSWKIFELKERILLDNKTDSEKYEGCRNDQVIVGGNKWTRYVDILNDLTPEERQVLLDKRINIKKASEVEVNLTSENLLSLWYLLFGCEVLRNPAAIIHHNMVFDLIKSEKLKWGVEMIAISPMLTTGVIKKAMKLNQDYNEFMPHKYLYQSTYYNYKAGDLVKKEANITKAWLQFKLGEGASSNLINNCATDNNAVQTIWQLLMESFDGWGLRSVLTQSNNDKRSKNDEKTQLVQDPDNVDMLYTASLMSISSPIKPHQVQSDNILLNQYYQIQ